MKIEIVYRSKSTLLKMFALFFLFTSFSFAEFNSKGESIIVNLQEIEVTGVVKDGNGVPLPGATVIIKGTNRGTSTDFDGRYSIKADEDAVLVFSFVGAITQEINVSGENVINVTLEEDLTQLDEVVVVGYGQQKKVNLTASVETVTFNEAVNQPVTNTAQLMYGRFAGVQLTQSSGSPGADGSSIIIRGIGTFSNSTPLIVIDNIQYNDLATFNSLAPSDIESVTVLKDASSSAIYGARGANGVILITTKKGKADKFEINYNSYYGFQEATVVPEFLGAYDYATIINEKFFNQDGIGFTPRFTNDQLEAIRTGSLPDQFANTKWTDEILVSAPITNHNISFTGGNEKTTYRFSLGYLNQESIVRSKFKSERYNLSFNFNSKLKNWLTLNSVTNGYWKSNVGPTGGQNALTGTNGIIYQFQRTAPTIPAYYSNGEYGIVDGAYYNANPTFLTHNPIRRGFLGNNEFDKISLNQRIGLTIKLTDNLTFETSGSANIDYINTSNFNPTAIVRDWDGNIIQSSEINSLSNSTGFNYKLLNENILRYNKTINDVHNVGVLIGHSVDYYKSDGFSGQLSGFPTDNLEEFNAGGVIDPTVSGGASEDANQSFFGRVNYNYDGKYLVEFAFRRDASSKFGSSFRNGNYPSVSAGWRISEEDFFNVDFMNNLKIRGSWGINGNDRIGRYIYSQTYNPGIDYVLGDDVTVVGVAQTSLSNPFIKWEETEQYDIGLDAGFIKNKIELVVDYFKRNSKDILYRNFPIPSTIGIGSLAAQNAASMVSEGLEISLNHRNNLGDFKIAVGASMTKFLNNEVTGLGVGGEETIGGYDIIRIGEPFKAYYGYQAIGVFQDWNEIINSPTQFGNSQTAPGDLKYADLSGPDGIPDGIVDADDRTIIGNPQPDILINFNGSIEYNGIDFSFMFQGVSGIDRLLMDNGNFPMNDDRSNALSYWINRWTPENPSSNLPRVGGQNNALVSTFYIQDASYLRLKNIELGYTLPKEITNKININKLRVFISGQNLITYTGLENFDPERGAGRSSNRNVPLTKTFTLGVNIKL